MVWEEHITLIDSIADTSAGTWKNTSGLAKKTIHIKGITNATIQLRGSNGATQPTDNGEPIGADITEDLLIEVTSALPWMKAMITSHTAGTISALLYGLTPG